METVLTEFQRSLANLDALITEFATDINHEPAVRLCPDCGGTRKTEQGFICERCHNLGYVRVR
jgi:uncharacterized paraquat-inducible protein A